MGSVSSPVTAGGPLPYNSCLRSPVGTDSIARARYHVREQNSSGYQGLLRTTMESDLIIVIVQAHWENHA